MRVEREVWGGSRGPASAWRRAALAQGILCLALLAPSAAAAVGAASDVPLQASCGTGLLGDVTGDGNVNIIDAQQIARWSVGLPVSGTVEARLPTNGDVTGDGNVNIIDAQQVARWSVGFTTTFPIGDPLPACEGIRVTTSTSGQDLDPDGYQVLLDGVFASDIGVSGVVDLTGAAPGSHTVTLQGLAANCTITNGTATRNVTVVEGEATSADYTVQCTGTGGQGTLEVRNTTSGALPGQAYTVTLDGGSTKSMAVNGTVTFDGVSFGSHQVTLGNLQGCTVSGGATQTVSVESGFNILHYSVTCGAPDPVPDTPQPRLP